MDFKIDFNIDFSDNEFEKYLANPSQYIEDAKAKMRENAYKKARAELEATRQKAVAFAKLQSELKAYQQELQVEVNQYMKSETQKLIASVQGSTTPNAESQLPSPPQIESPKIANPQPDNPKASQQRSSTQKSEKPKDNKKATPKSVKAKAKAKAEEAKKETRADRIKRLQDELKEEQEKQMANDLISALFEEADEQEYPSEDLYNVIQNARHSNLDQVDTMRLAIQRAMDHGADLDRVANYYHMMQQERLGKDYDFDTSQKTLDEWFDAFADNYQPMVSFNNPADADEHEETARRLESRPDFSEIKRMGGF